MCILTQWYVLIYEHEAFKFTNSPNSKHDFNIKHKNIFTKQVLITICKKLVRIRITKAY